LRKHFHGRNPKVIEVFLDAGGAKSRFFVNRALSTGYVWFCLLSSLDFKLAFTKESQEIMKLFWKIQRNRFIFVNSTFVLIMFDSEVIRWFG
jgi:hypothetical protein